MLAQQVALALRLQLLPQRVVLGARGRHHALQHRRRRALPRAGAQTAEARLRLCQQPPQPLNLPLAPHEIAVQAQERLRLDAQRVSPVSAAGFGQRVQPRRLVLHVPALLSRGAQPLLREPQLLLRCAELLRQRIGVGVGIRRRGLCLLGLLLHRGEGVQLGLDRPDVFGEAVGVVLERPGENATLSLAPLAEIATADASAIAGRYVSDELEAAMTIEARDGAAYAVFEGMLGQGRRERLAPLAEDVWSLATRRAMDAPAPGDWTLLVQRDDAGQVIGASLGCWLARRVSYRREG